MPGDEFTFTGLTAPTNGVEGASGFVYTGPAIVDSIEVAWDWVSGAPVQTTVNFSGNGELEKSTDTLSDATTPDGTSTSECYIEIVGHTGGSPTAASLCGVTAASLNITAANQSYASSCTGG